MKKIVSLLLILFMLSGCVSFNNGVNDASTSANNYDEISATYLTKLKEFKSKGRNINNTVDNTEFDEFLDEVFINQVKDDYTTLTSNIKDYRALGFEKPEVSLGKIEYGVDEDAINEEIKELDTLLTFDYDSLSYRQQIDYECLEYSFYEDLSTLAYTNYEKLFDNNAALVSNVIDYLTNFDFWDKEYLDDYLVLVGDIDRYLDDAVAYTNLQYQDDIYYSDYSLENTIDYINSFISKEEDNVLITTFGDNISKLDFLSKDEMSSYVEKNKKLVLDEVIPAFKKLAKSLESFKGKADSADVSLSNVSDAYAEMKFMLSYSDNASVEDIYSELVDAYSDSIDYLNSFDSSSEVVRKYSELYYDDMFSKSYKELVDYLIDKTDIDDSIVEYFDYSIDDMDESIASSTTVAYYMSGPLDILHDNTIKVNPNLTDKDIELYITLSHETIPGHMYQMNMYKLSEPKYIRESMTFLGYTEGYASYSEYIALGYLDVSDELRDYIMNSIEYDYYFSCIVDILVNYYGYNEKNIRKIINVDASTATRYINLFSDMASAYSPYGIGYMKMYKLYTTAKNQLGDKFDFDEFNELLIKNGPMPYPILESIVDEYIESK